MKKTWSLWFVLIMLALFGNVVLAQTDQEKADFEAFKQFQAMKSGQSSPAIVQNPVETVSKWAGMGKEIGTVLRETVQTFDGTLTVTEEHIYKFLSTDVGKLTLFIVIWKVVGMEVISVGVGLIFIIAFFFYVHFAIRHLFLGRRRFVRKEGKERIYEFIEGVVRDNNVSADATFANIAVVLAIGAVLFVTSMLLLF